MVLPNRNYFNRRWEKHSTQPWRRCDRWWNNLWQFARQHQCWNRHWQLHSEAQRGWVRAMVDTNWNCHWHGWNAPGADGSPFIWQLCHLWNTYWWFQRGHQCGWQRLVGSRVWHKWLFAVVLPIWNVFRWGNILGWCLWCGWWSGVGRRCPELFLQQYSPGDVRHGGSQVFIANFHDYLHGHRDEHHHLIDDCNSQQLEYIFNQHIFNHIHFNNEQ